MNLYCLACDNAGDHYEIQISTVDDLPLIGAHYAARHPDIDLDEVADTDIVTMFPHRLRSVRA